MSLMSPTRLPRSFEEFTPEFFTQALSAKFPGVEVSALSRSGERVGTSASCTFALEYANRGTSGNAPDSVFVKGGFTPKQLKRYWTVLQQEARFFSEIAQDVPMNIPACYYAACDEERQGITMLEDLVATRGARFVFMNKGWGALSVDDVSALLEQLARLHARWAGDPRLKTMAGFEMPQRLFMKYCIRDEHWNHVLERPFGHRLASIFPDVNLAREALDRNWALNDAAPHTLLHGDPHGGNVFIEGDGKYGWMDFQLYFAGTYMYDVSYLIVTGLNLADRRAEERRLLREYLAVARAEGMAVDSEDDAWLMYRQQMAHAVINGTSNPDESAPKEFFATAGELVTIAAEDHDVLQALGMRP